MTDGVYTMESIEDEQSDAPTISFDTHDKTFQFTYDLLSSYLNYGTYLIQDDEVIATTSDGKYTYTFKIVDDDTISFIAEKSDSTDTVEGVTVVPNKAIFKNPIFEAETQEDSEQLDISLNIKEYYISNTGNPSNLYYIDENNILWGSGRNEYGQLGQGTQDYEFYSDMIKIAENVIHVDYSQTGFTIFLTKDNQLYGMGNAGTGALLQYGGFDWTRYTNGENYAVTTPILLMENVAYARCGRDDIVCQKEDGTVWTWGDNSAGNCGVADLFVVSKPTMVAEDVAMVWTDLAIDSYPQPNEEDIAMAWTGKLKYNSEYNHIAEFNDIYPKYLNNTVIRKTDGSYWVCGENVGTQEKLVSGIEGDYSIVCTDQFTLCE